MFTGLVQTTATVRNVREESPGRSITLEVPLLAGKTNLGDSICISGCCLTVVEIQDSRFRFQAGPETLAKTTLGELQPNDQVNVESSLRMGDPLGGHLVTGHVDGVGRVASRDDLGEWSNFWFSAPAGLLRQMAPKASIAIDGVSLTLVDVTDAGFSVALIPHTLSATTLGSLGPGDRVNLETDLLAKYVERQLAAWGKIGATP